MSTELAMSTQSKRRFDALMEQTYKKVFNLTYRLAGNRVDAEDLTQEAFYRAYRSFGDYEGDKPFENWIFRIAARLFLDLLRNRKRRVQTVSYDTPLPCEGSGDGLFFEVPDYASDPEKMFLEDILSEDLQIALSLLNKDQRLLILLADIEGRPYREIAQILGKPIGTVRSRLHRTHRMLRNHLDAIQKDKSEQNSLNSLNFQVA